MYEEENIEPDFMKRPPKNPFRTPDSYFESLEDRIMGNIKDQTKKSSSTRIIRFLKPALGIAASITLVYMLAYYPINKFLLKDTVQTELTDTTGTDLLNDYSINIASIDDNSLINAIFTDETNIFAETNPDEFLAYLSTGLNDVEIYSEIQN
ncbi:MAG: hypothetical protein Q8S54_01840 [Bacteroidota bacterium]|nr:hypothetical protein [Odoribacter sp.]MDP3641911.1 hypothetical protein [Bacteroidota bacterium]